MAADISRGAGPGTSRPRLPPGPGTAPGSTGWTAGRVVTLVAGSFAVLLSAVLLVTAGILAWADQVTHGGYLTTGSAAYSTAGYAVATDPGNVHGPWGWLGRWADAVQVQVTADRAGTPVFAAIGPAADVSRYLAGVSYVSVGAIGDHDVTRHQGSVIPAPPATALDWTAQARGTGSATLRWTVRSGDWTLLVMKADGAPGVTIRAEMGVSSPVLAALAGTALAAAITAGVIGAALIVIAARLAGGGTRAAGRSAC